MATQNNSAFYLEALKALKMAGEQSPFGSDERKIYSSKANSLRELLKNQFGMANIDADYGAGVALKDTPGGGKIDWNVLANAADTLGLSQAGSTRSAFDRALGEYLTRNLPVWQKQNAQSPSAAITSTSSSVMGGGGAAQSIIGGQPISNVNSGMQASQATATQQAKAAGTWNMGAAEGIESTDTAGTPIPTGTGAGTGSGTGLYGDFIKSEYFKNNDFDGYFLSINKNLNLPTITDPTTGKVTIDWNAKDANGKYLVSVSVFNSYGNMTKLWNTMQGLSKEKDTFNATDIEKNPVFTSQMKVFDEEMASLQKQFGLNVDAQIAGLKGSQEANKAALEYELTTIKREIGASNWRSRQSLAASGMAFSGMLGYLYGQNEAKGMDATIRATAISAAEIKALGEQMAILEGSKLSYASDLERIYGAKRANYRASLVDPSNKRYQEIEDLLDDAIAGFETEKGLINPSIAVEGRQDEAAAAQATTAAVQGLNKDQLTALDKGYRITGVDENGVYSYSPILSGKELADFITEGYRFNENGTLAAGYEPPLPTIATWLGNGVLYDPETRTLSQVMTPKEVADFGIEGYSVDPKTGAVLAYEPTPQQIAEWLSKGVRYDPKTKTFSKITPVAGTGGGGDNTTTTTYDPKSDFSILSNSGAPTEAKDLASLRLIVGTGALTADNFARIVDGQEYWAYVDDSGKTQFVYSEAEIPLNKRNFGQWITWRPRAPVKNTAGKFAGIMDMNDTTFEGILKLVTDPVMAVALATVKDIADSGSRNPGDWVTIANAYIQEYGLGGAEQSEIHDLLRSYFNQ